MKCIWGQGNSNDFARDVARVDSAISSRSRKVMPLEGLQKGALFQMKKQNVRTLSLIVATMTYLLIGTVNFICQDSSVLIPSMIIPE